MHVLLHDQHGTTGRFAELGHDGQETLDDNRRQPQTELIEQQ